MTRILSNSDYDYYHSSINEISESRRKIQYQLMQLEIQRDIQNVLEDSVIYGRTVQVRPDLTQFRHYKSTWNDYFADQGVFNEYKKFFEPLKKIEVVDLDEDDEDCI